MVNFATWFSFTDRLHLTSFINIGLMAKCKILFVQKNIYLVQLFFKLKTFL